MISEALEIGQLLCRSWLNGAFAKGKITDIEGGKYIGGDWGQLSGALCSTWGCAAIASGLFLFHLQKIELAQDLQIVWRHHFLEVGHFFQ